MGIRCRRAQTLPLARWFAMAHRRFESNGAPAPGQDPQCATEPVHCTFLGRLPMEPEAPWAVDQAIASRTGKGAPAGLGTVKPDVGGHVNPAFPMNDRYLALEAYKFAVPNTKSTLPGSTCPTCSNPNLTGANTWTPRALAELVEGLGGAIVATHSQSGLHGTSHGPHPKGGREA